MKNLFLGVLVACTTLASFLESVAAAPVRLCGIVNLPGMKVAFVEKARAGKALEPLRLAEGQRDGAVAVIAIQPGQGVVQLRINGEVTAVTNLAVRIESASGIALEQIDVDSALMLLSDLAERTILRHPWLFSTNLTLKAEIASTSSASELLKNVLAENRVLIIPDGPKFLLAVPQNLKSQANPHAPQPESKAATNATELLPPGLVDFRNAHIRDVLVLYAELRGCQFDPQSPLPPGIAPTIKFKTRNALTKGECLYAFETLLEWAGVQVVPENTAQLKVVPVR